MNSQERLETMFRGEIPDRIPIIMLGLRPHWEAERFATSGRIVDRVPIWPNDPGCDPSVEELLGYARHRTDMLLTWGPPPNAFWSALDAVKFEKQEVPCSTEGYHIDRTICHAPAGDLVHEEYVSRIGLPPYPKRRFIQNEEDLRIFLSIPDERVPLDEDSFWEFRRSLPDDCCYIIMPGFAPAPTLYELIEAETFLMWSVEKRSLLFEVTEMLAERRLRLVKDLLAAGIGPIYQTLGHEEFIPPLMSPADFREFVLAHDRKMCDAVHDAGGWVFCHCHGRVGKLLEEFPAVGIDSLQPLEPAPMGDTDFADVKRRIGGHTVLFGNIQTHDLMTCTPEQIRQLVRETVEAGKPGGRFGLCPSAEIIVGPSITPRTLENLKVFIDTAIEFGSY